MSGASAVPLLVAALGLLLHASLFVLIAAQRTHARGRGGAPPSSITREDRERWLVVIPTVGPAELLERCLRAAIVALRGVDAQIVVACDHRDPADLVRNEAVVQRIVDSVDGAERSIVVVPSGLMLPTRHGKAEALNLVLSLRQQRWRWPHAAGDREGRAIRQGEFFLCVDVDEQLSPEGFDALADAAAKHPDAALIQAAKHDIAVTSSWFGRAFQAQYSSWFHWEAAWVCGLRSDRFLASSYYGSMAAIRLRDDMMGRVVLCLADGGRLDGVTLFPESRAVEDFPLYASKLTGARTVLIEQPAGVGDAPLDAAALLALWYRWTLGNVPVAADLARTMRRHPWSLRQVLVATYHASSWYAYVVVGTLPFLAVPAVLASGRVANAAFVAMGAALTCEVLRRLLPSPGSRPRDRLVRLSVDLMLWPVAITAIWHACSGASSPLASNRATPRIPGHRIPRFVRWAYGCQAGAVVLAGSLALSAGSLARGAVIGAFGAALLAGLVAWALESRRAAHGRLDLIDTHLAHESAAA